MLYNIRKHTVNLLTKFSTINTMDSVRDLVLHMYSLVHKALVLEISKDVNKDRKASSFENGRESHCK